MASFTFDCPDCGQNLEAPNDMAGLELACPSCSAQLRIPTYDPQGRIGPATLDDAQPVLEPPQHPPRLKLRDTGTDGARSSGGRCPKCRRAMDPAAVVCVHCGYDLKRRRSLRTRTRAVYPGGGIRFSGWRTDSGPPRRNFASWAMIAVVLVAGVALLYVFNEKRKANRQTAALRAQRQRVAARPAPSVVEGITQAEEEKLREQAVRQEEERRLAREQTERDKEYAARSLFLECCPWSSRSGQVIDAKLAGYGSSWVVFKTASGKMMAVERDNLSAHDLKRLEQVESVLKVRDTKWDDYARNILGG